MNSMLNNLEEYSLNQIYNEDSYFAIKKIKDKYGNKCIL